MPNFEKIKLIVFGAKPKRTPKYAGVVRQWGWSSESIYRWRHSSYDNLEKRMVSTVR